MIEPTSSMVFGPHAVDAGIAASTAKLAAVLKLVVGAPCASAIAGFLVTFSPILLPVTLVLLLSAVDHKRTA